MSYIESISFENFRIFETEHNFEFKPLTFLVGPNSSGKSSILKAFLLLKSNVQNDLQLLDFSNTKHNLGNFNNTTNKYCQSKDIKFSFSATLNSMSPTSYHKIQVASKRTITSVLVEPIVQKNTNITLSITYQKNEESGEVKEIEVLNSKNESFLKLKISNKPSESNQLIFKHELVLKDKVLSEILIKSVIREDYKINPTVKDSTDRFIYRSDYTINTNPISIFANLYEKFVTKYIKYEFKRGISKYSYGQPLRRILKDFSYLIENTEYIEAVRANTKRLYTNDSQGTSFNELILEFRSRKLNAVSIDFIDRWLKEFEIADSIKISDVEGVANSVYLIKDEEPIALADLGYGITQFLPILLKLSLEQPSNNNEGNKNVKCVKKTILLEEPETNLHPKLQSRLADFLLDAINTFEINFVVETHSEYIIRKLQILTAENKISNNDSVIYYFNNPLKKNDNNDYYDSDNQVVKININPNGSLDNHFGEGFFDEATDLKFQLLQHKLKN